jgi:hypothetical protein
MFNDGVIMTVFNMQNIPLHVDTRRRHRLGQGQAKAQMVH